MAIHLGGGARAMSDINVTPMVDVMLVLLIIFMVTAPFIQQGVPVNLPTAKAATLNVQEDRLVVTLTRDKHIYVGKADMPYASFKEKLAGNLKLRQDKEVYLHADRDLPYGYVVDVMAVLKDAGVLKLSMVTDPVAGKPQ